MPNPQEATTQEAEELSSERAANQEQEQTPDPASAGQSTQDDQDALPEKFRGKSAADVYRSYQELEKKLGSMSSELAHSQREKDAEATRRAYLEEQLTLRSQQQQPEEDPLSDVEQSAESDPIGTVKKLASTVKQLRNRTKEELLTELRRQQAAEFYNSQMRDNSDFRELEPTMRQLAPVVARFVKPEFMQSKEVLEALHLIAKAQNLPRYVKEAEEKAKKAIDWVKDEKRRAFSESSAGASSSSAKRPEDMSLDELRKAIGVVED